MDISLIFSKAIKPIVADMDIHNEEHPAMNFEARTSAGHQGDGMPYMFSFERYMVIKTA